MKEIKSVAIVGMGALGLLYADTITKSGKNIPVDFIMDDERASRHASDNFTINGQPKTFSIKKISDASPVDLVIVAVKGTGLESAIPAIKSVTTPDTIIISVLNGISSEDFLSNYFPRNQIISTVAQGMDAMRFGSTLNFTRAGELHIGTGKNESAENLDTLARFFDFVNLPHVIEKDIVRRMWSKFMLNVGINQTCMAYSATYSKVINTPELFKVFTGAMEEVIKIANAENVELTQKDLNFYVDIIKTLDPDGTPSMGQDGINRHKSEVELFAGTVIKIAVRHNISVPVNQMLYEKIQKIEAEY